MYKNFEETLAFDTWGFLAEQVWRLITYSTTLAYKVLKARYFPRSSFFDAKVGYCPSYIWHSFIVVKELVHKGCKWNIGEKGNMLVHTIAAWPLNALTMLF